MSVETFDGVKMIKVVFTELFTRYFTKRVEAEKMPDRWCQGILDISDISSKTYFGMWQGITKNEY